MKMTIGRIRKFRGSRRGRFRPSMEQNPREKVINNIQHDLYDPHWKFWHKKLNALIAENSGYHGRPRQINQGIFYANQAWFVPTGAATEVSEFDIIPLHPEYPKLEETAIKITANLSELDIETYEVKRFLAGLMLFPAPQDIMKTLLGSALYGRIGKYYQELESENKGHVWNDAISLAFHSYAAEHDYLINAMCQRVMMNLITRDAFAAR
jgi:hypothetical protein